MNEEKKQCPFCSGPAWDVVPAAERMIAGLGEAQRAKIAARLLPGDRVQKLEAVCKAAERVIEAYVMGGDAAEELKAALRAVGSHSEFIAEGTATSSRKS